MAWYFIALQSPKGARDESEPKWRGSSSRVGVHTQRRARKMGNPIRGSLPHPTAEPRICHHQRRCSRCKRPIGCSCNDGQVSITSVPRSALPTPRLPREWNFHNPEPSRRSPTSRLRQMAVEGFEGSDWYGLVILVYGGTNPLKCVSMVQHST